MRRKLGTLLGLAIVCVGGSLVLLTRTFYPNHVLGIFLIMIGPIVAARVRGTPADIKAANAYSLAYVRQWQNLKRTWPAGVTVSALLFLSFYLLHLDAVEGYEQVFPVYFFAGAGLVFMGYILYLGVPRQN
jgi:hypothetical protein